MTTWASFSNKQRLMAAASYLVGRRLPMVRECFATDTATRLHALIETREYIESVIASDDQSLVGAFIASDPIGALPFTTKMAIASAMALNADVRRDVFRAVNLVMEKYFPAERPQVVAFFAAYGLEFK